MTFDRDYLFCGLGARLRLRCFKVFEIITWSCQTSTRGHFSSPKMSIIAFTKDTPVLIILIITPYIGPYTVCVCVGLTLMIIWSLASWPIYQKKKNKINWTSMAKRRFWTINLRTNLRWVAKFTSKFTQVAKSHFNFPARCNSVLKVTKKYCVDMRCVAKRWKNLRLLAPPFDQGAGQGAGL